MRHFLLFLPIAALAFGVGMTASPRGLVAPTRSPDCVASCLIGTVGGAVTVASITRAANDNGCAAARAQVESSRNVHRLQGPMGGDGNTRFVKYSACSVARLDSGARHRNWLGGWDRCRAGISTG